MNFTVLVFRKLLYPKLAGLQPDPAVSCEFSKVALPDYFPFSDRLLAGENCGSPLYCLATGSGPGAYQV